MLSQNSLLNNFVLITDLWHSHKSPLLSIKLSIKFKYMQSNTQLPDDLRDPAVSISFGQSMKTHLFSAYQHV